MEMLCHGKTMFHLLFLFVFVFLFLFFVFCFFVKLYIFRIFFWFQLLFLFLFFFIIIYFYFIVIIVIISFFVKTLSKKEKSNSSWALPTRARTVHTLQEETLDHEYAHEVLQLQTILENKRKKRTQSRLLLS